LKVPTVSETVVKHKLVSKEQVAKDRQSMLLQKDLLLLAMASTTLYTKARTALRESKIKINIIALANVVFNKYWLFRITDGTGYLRVQIPHALLYKTTAKLLQQSNG